jgi:hypothetical protein
MHACTKNIPADKKRLNRILNKQDMKVVSGYMGPMA